jgi:hypothetical protein
MVDLSSCGSTAPVQAEAPLTRPVPFDATELMSFSFT